VWSALLEGKVLYVVLGERIGLRGMGGERGFRVRGERGALVLGGGAGDRGSAVLRDGGDMALF